MILTALETLVWEYEVFHIDQVLLTKSLTLPLNEASFLLKFRKDGHFLLIGTA